MGNIKVTFLQLIYIFLTIIGVFTIIILHSCNGRDIKPSIADIQWLEGNWKSVEGSRFFESWELKNDKAMEGFGFTMENGDTLISELLRIYESDSGVFYSAIVANQTEKLPVRFKLIHHIKDSLVFSNPEHDFPRFIVYQRLSNDSIQVYVRDGFGNLSKGFDLLMVKMKEF